MSTLLIVEADAEIAYLYRALFRLHQIFVCPDTRAAIEFLHYHRPDLVQHRAHTMGLDAFLPKPLNIPHLLSTVLHLLNREKSAGNSRMQEALDEYLDAYQRVYGRYPNLRWVGSYIMLGKERLDEARLKAETRRLHDQRAERENQALAET